MKVAVAGYGIEGQVSYEYYRSRGDDVVIVDESETPKVPIPEDAETQLGGDVFAKLHGYDLVVRTAGLNPNRIKTDGKIWSATNEFFTHCPAPIIGVTGTKGKGTTCSLIASILREAGYTVHLVGNIGVPALSVLGRIREEDVVVYELSSFQLWDLERSPHVAVVLMIEPDHLDVHADMDEYVVAKANIARFQGIDDVVVYHPTNAFSADIARAGEGGKVRYGIPDDGQVYVKSNTFFIRNTALCTTDALKLVGEFNLENACAAISAALMVANVDGYVEAGLSAFDGLPHRLKFVREVDGVSYYDNSIATTPGSTITAIESFDGPKLVLLGGSDKGASYDGVVSACKRTGTIVVAMGQTGERIYELCRSAGVDAHRIKGRMDEIVPAAQRLMSRGGTVILSPASASFDQYKSYSDRGDQFIAAVGEL